MEQEYFANKISCAYTVITHVKNCQIVTKELCIEPNRFFNKDDAVISRHSNSLITRPHGLWEINSKDTISEDLDISSHIKYFQKLLADKIEVIEKLKNDYQFECVFSIYIETEDAGVGIDLNDKELTFISKIASRYSCTFISKETVG